MYASHSTKRKRTRVSAVRILAAVVGIFFVGVGMLDILYRMSGFSSVVAADNSAVLASLARPQSRAELPAFVPTRFLAPSIGVNAQIEAVGLNQNGNMTAPSGYTKVAWYKDGSRPGNPGTTVIAGHLNNFLGLSGVFENLNDLNLGDTVIVEGENGEARYVVRSVTVYSAYAAPNDQIFATSGSSRLILITCDGAWDKGARSYDKRLVVEAELL